MARATKDDVKTEPTPTRRRTSSRAHASPGVRAKGAALVAIGALSVAVVGLAIGKRGAPAPQVHDTTNDKDYPKMVLQANGRCVEAARRARAARALDHAGDRAGARAALKEAIALLDQAGALYEEVSNAHPGGEFDYCGSDIDRMTLERTTYRKMLMELGD